VITIKKLAEFRNLAKKFIHWLYMTGRRATKTTIAMMIVPRLKDFF